VKKIMKNKMLFVLLLLPLLVFNAYSNTFASEGNPVKIKGNDQPNNDSIPSKLWDLKQYKVEVNGNQSKSETYLDGALKVTFDDDKTVNWESKIGIKYVYVKGGNAGNLYEYKEGETFDTLLEAPKNRGRQRPDIGHVSFYYEEEPVKLFENPVIGDGADPWVVKHTDGYYYYTQTTGNNITIRKSKTLTGLENAKSKVVWTPSQSAPNRAHIWAPELHFLDGKWYVYFAASDGDMEKQRSYVIQSETDDPFSNYSYPDGTEYGKISDPSDKWAIDGTILEYNDKMYFVWSGWEGNTNVSQHIYIAPMSNPWTISGERVELSRPEYDWEKIGFPHINEGPQILKNDEGEVFIVYSASGSWTDDYSLAMLKLTGTDPLDSNSWNKHPEPVFKKNPDAGVFGPGHASFVKSPDGSEDWIVYHAAKFQGAGWNRNVRMQKFTWNEDGTPNFGKPVSAQTLLPVPSGESAGTLTPAFPESYKLEAEDATVNKAKIVTNSSASNGKKVGYIDYEDSYVEFNPQVPAGDYTMKIRYSNDMGQTATHQVAVNDEQIGNASYDSYGWDNWRYTEMDVTLDSKDNVIRFSKGKLFTELDFIELVPKNPSKLKYEAEHALVNKAKIANHPTASNGQKVGNVDYEDSYVEYRIDVPKSARYDLDITYSNGTDSVSTHQLSVNGELVGSIDYQNVGWNNWKTTSTEIHVEEGINTIRFSKAEGFAELDHIVFSPK
jgi:GH43 family beta-xylosidase